MEKTEARVVQRAHEKYKELEKYFKKLGSAAIAFSGGVDSAFLLRAAHEILGDPVIAVTADSLLFPKRELEDAKNFIRDEGVRHVIFELEELKIEGFCENPVNRCYLCKKEMLRKISEIAKANQIPYVAEGSNADDDGDYRPGLMAVKELSIKSPLRETGFTKKEIRMLAREWNLPVWDKPSFACLASRFVYGEVITEEKLKMADLAEQLLLDFGFHQMRVRIHGNMARIEVMPEEFEKLLETGIREEIIKRYKEYGFAYVTMDLQGYRTGSMNEILSGGEKKNQKYHWSN